MKSEREERVRKARKKQGKKCGKGKQDESETSGVDSGLSDQEGSPMKIQKRASQIREILWSGKKEQELEPEQYGYEQLISPAQSTPSPPPPAISEKQEQLSQSNREGNKQKRKMSGSFSLFNPVKIIKGKNESEQSASPAQLQQPKPSKKQEEPQSDQGRNTKRIKQNGTFSFFNPVKMTKGKDESGKTARQSEPSEQQEESIQSGEQQESDKKERKRSLLPIRKGSLD